MFQNFYVIAQSCISTCKRNAIGKAGRGLWTCPVFAQYSPNVPSIQFNSIQFNLDFTDRNNRQRGGV